MNLPHRDINKIQKDKSMPRQNVEELIALSSHTLIRKANRVSCTVCHSSFRINDPSCKPWLSTVCHPVPFSPHIEHKVINVTEPIHIGNQLSHSTHCLRKYRGLLYCSKCGARSGNNQIRLLARQCTPPTKYGQRTLDELENGQIPAGLSQWPDGC